ncbi:related to Chitinase [Sporisorium reilianum SRZ2]|uniref:Related to Chitinase n=1 Tax=Sporisorium reilianum (strain SRZ2) TaxID=999809 RepID=E6ZW50_SPORE|nr:related to Chitinase [Sporisorium reilianum SRZ2]
MKLLPLGVLALASLLTSSAAAGDEFGQPHLPSQLGRTWNEHAGAGSSNTAQQDSRPVLSYAPDRPSAASTSTGHLAIQRRSLWQLLFGNEGGAGKQKRRAVPSARMLPRQRRRANSSRTKRAKGSCKAPTSASASSSSSASATAATSTSSASPASPTNDSNETRTSTNKTMAAYWPDWTASTLPPTSIDFSKFDILNYAFALPTADFSLSIPTDPSGGTLRRFVQACKAGDTKAVLSLGGWGGSTYFSPAVRTAASRATFIANIVRTYNTYGLDGIDLDWEYPGQTGAGNQLDASDTANFQTFLQELRAALPREALLTAAVGFTPWIGSSGAPVGSVARAAGVLDYVMIMNYDVWGSSSNPGPNAPLANLCGNSTQPGANAAAGVRAWSAAGMPRNKILLGIPAYGYISQSSKQTLRTRSPAKRAVKLTSSDGSSNSGQINFSSLVSQGALKLGKDGLYDATGGFTKYWDDCSDTPYLSDGTRVVTYDDTSSIFDKGAFASAAGIGGISMWSLDGDTSTWALTNSAIAGMSSTGVISS